MRFQIIVGLLLLVFIQVSAASLAQSVTINVKNTSLEKVFKLMEKQTGYAFLFDDVEIKNKKVSLSVQNTSIEKVLELCLENLPVTYKVVDKNILFKRNTDKKNNRTVSKAIAVQQQTITGQVQDSTGRALSGVEIAVEGTNRVTVTDARGQYQIAASPSEHLLFNLMGHERQRVAVGTKTQINTIMKAVASGLDEVVVIGYGKQKRSSIVASLSSIGSAELNVKQRNLRNSIAGQIAGVIAVQRSGEPGNDAAAFYIRGQSSYAGGTSPLVLIDGVPRNMDDIDVDEIESFTVLKDAAATAVYGAEGANGVVLITSKRGRVEKTRMSSTAQYSVVTPQRLPQALNAYDYLSLWNEAIWNDQGNPWDNFFIPDVSNTVLNKYRMGGDPDLYPSVNWNELLSDRTHNQRYTTNFRGGSEKNRYFVSGSYYAEDGIFNSNPIEKYDANIGLQRFNLRSNIDMDLTKSTLLSVDMSGQYLHKNNPGYTSDEIFEYIAHYPTHVIPMYYSDGTASDHPSAGFGTITQPYNMLNNSGYTKSWNAFIQSKITLEQKMDFLTKGLSAKGIFSFDADFTSSMKRDKTPKSYAALGYEQDGTLSKKIMNEGSALSDPWKSGSYGAKKIYMEGSLNYIRSFASKHDVTGLLLYMQKETQYQDKEGVQLLPYRKQSVVGRATYGYDNRYMLEGSMGITGSENFASGNRWGFFPAVGAAWYISNEDFFNNLTTPINNLKVRASIGMTGNDNIGSDIRFPYRGTINIGSGGYNFGLSPGPNGSASNWQHGIVEGSFGAPNLSWEKERKINIGLDLGVFNNKLDFSIDYFTNRRDDILIQRETISGVAGFRNMPFQNFGITTNKGIDASLILKHRVNKVNISARGNITYAKNKIVEKDEVAQIHPWLLQTGNSIGQPKMYLADGLYTPDDFHIQYDISNGAQTYVLKEHLAKPSAYVAPGDIKYKDLNNDGIIDSYDMTYQNNFYPSLPEIVYGFGLNADWKGFFIGVFFQGVARTTTNMMSNVTNLMPFTIGRDRTSARTEVLSRWSADNPYEQIVFFPRLHSTDFRHNTMKSSWWHRDASFLRLKNIEIGYEFNKNTLKSLKMQNLRLYLQGHNIAVWDKIKYWDPELGDAASGAKYPLSSTYTIGLEVTF